MAERINLGKDLKSRTRSSESEVESNALKVAQAADQSGGGLHMVRVGAGKLSPSRQKLILNERPGQERSLERTAVQGTQARMGSRIEKKLNVVSVQYGADIARASQTSYAGSQFKVRMNNPSLKRFQSPKQREMKTQIQWQQPAQHIERDPTDQMKDEIAQFLNLKLLQHELPPQSREDVEGDHQEPHVVSGTDSGAHSSRVRAYSPRTEEQVDNEFRETLLMERKAGAGPVATDSVTQQAPDARLEELAPSSEINTVSPRRPRQDDQDGQELRAPLHQAAAGKSAVDGQRPKGDMSADQMERNQESVLSMILGTDQEQRTEYQRANEPAKEDSQTRSMRHSSLSMNRRASLEDIRELEGLANTNQQEYNSGKDEVAGARASDHQVLKEVDLDRKAGAQDGTTEAEMALSQVKKVPGQAPVRQAVQVRSEKAPLQGSDELALHHRVSSNSGHYALLPAPGEFRNIPHHQVNIAIPGSAPENTLSSVGEGQTPGIAPVYRGAPRITSKGSLHRSGHHNDQSNRSGHGPRKGSKHFAAVTNVEIVPRLHHRKQHSKRRGMQSVKQNQFHFFIEPSIAVSTSPSQLPANATFISNDSAQVLENIQEFADGKVNPFQQAQNEMLARQEDIRLMNKTSQSIINRALPFRLSQVNLKENKVKNMRTLDDNSSTQLDGGFQDAHSNNHHSASPWREVRLNYQSQAELDQLQDPQSEAHLQTASQFLPINQNQKYNNRYISSSVDFGDSKKEAIIVIPQASHPQRDRFQLQARGTKSSTLKLMSKDSKEKDGETPSPRARRQAEAQAKRRRQERPNAGEMSTTANLGKNVESHMFQTYGATDRDRHQHHMSTTSRFLPAAASMNETLTAYSRTSGFLPSIPASQYAGGNTSIYNTFNCTIYGPASDTRGFKNQVQKHPAQNAIRTDRQQDEKLTKDYISLQEQQQQLLRQREKYLMNMSQYRPAHIVAEKYRNSKDKHHSLKNPNQQSHGGFRVPMSTRVMQSQVQEHSLLQGDGCKHPYLKKAGKKLVGVAAHWRFAAVNEDNSRPPVRMTETLSIGGAKLHLNLQEPNDVYMYDGSQPTDARRSILLASPFTAVPKEAVTAQRSPEPSPPSRTSTTNGRANSMVQSTMGSAEKPALTRRRVDPDDATAAEPENGSSEKPVALSIPGSPSSATKVKQLVHIPPPQQRTQTQFSRPKPSRVITVIATTNQPQSLSPNYFPNQVRPLEIDDSKLLVVQQMNLSQREVEAKSPTGSHQGKPDASPMPQIQESHESSVNLLTKSASLDQEKACQEDNSTPDESANSGRGKRGREQILSKVPNNKKESSPPPNPADPFKNPANQPPTNANNNDIQPIEENEEKLMITNQISNSSKSLRYGDKMEYNVQFSQTMPKRHGHTQFMPQAKSAAYFRRTQLQREKAEERKRSSVYSQLSQAQIHANSDVALRSSGEKSLTYTSRNSMDHSLEGNVIKKSIYAKKFKRNQREDAKSGTLSNGPLERDPETLQVAPGGSLVPYASQTAMKKLRTSQPYHSVRQSAIKLNLKRPRPEQQAATMEAHQPQNEQGHRSPSGQIQPTRRSPTQRSSTRIQPNRAALDAKVFSSIKEGGKEGTSSALSTTRQNETSKRLSAGRQHPYILLAAKDQGAFEDSTNLNFDQQVDEETFENSNELPLITASQKLDSAQLKALRQANSSSVARKQMQKSRLAKQGPLASLKQPLAGSPNLRLNSQSGMMIHQVSPTQYGTSELGNYSKLSIGHSPIHRNSKLSHLNLQATSRSKPFQDAQLLSKTIAESLYSKGKKRVNFEAIIELEAMRSLDDDATLTSPSAMKAGRRKVQNPRLRNQFKTLEPPPMEAGKPGVMPSLVVSGGGTKPQRTRRDPMLKASVSKRLVDNYRQISLKQALNEQVKIGQSLEEEASTRRQQKAAARAAGLPARRELNKFHADFDDAWLMDSKPARKTKSMLPRIQRRKLNHSVNLTDQTQKASLFNEDATLYL